MNLYDGDAYNGWEIPKGDSPPNRRNYAQYHSPAHRLSDETESDTSGDIVYSPPDCQLDCHKVDDNLGLGKIKMRVFLVVNATLTWNKNIVGNVGTEDAGNTDFTNNGMPKFTDGTSYRLSDPFIKNLTPSGIFNESMGIYYNNTGTVTWRWSLPEHKVRDVVGYYVKITNQAGFTVVDDEYTTNTFYEKAGLSNGDTYYCKIKVKNDLGHVGSYCDTSCGVLVDMVDPEITGQITVDPNDWTNNNNFNVSWNEPNDDSGISKYYYSHSLPITGNSNHTLTNSIINMQVPEMGLNTCIWFQKMVHQTLILIIMHHVS